MTDEENQGGGKGGRRKADGDEEEDDDNDETPLIASQPPPGPPSPRGDIEMNPIGHSVTSATTPAPVEADLLELGPTLSKAPIDTLLDLTVDTSTVVLDRGAGRTAAPIMPATSVVPTVTPSSSSSPLMQPQRRGVSPSSSADMLELEPSPTGSPQRLKELKAAANRDRLIAKALADFVPAKSTASSTTGNPSGAVGGNGGSPHKKQGGSSGHKQSTHRKPSS